MLHSSRPATKQATHAGRRGGAIADVIDGGSWGGARAAGAAHQRCGPAFDAGGSAPVDSPQRPT